MEKEIGISFPGSSLSNSEFYHEQSEPYQELFLTNSKNAKKRLRRWTESVEEILKTIQSYDKNDQLNSGLIGTEFGSVIVPVTTYNGEYTTTTMTETESQNHHVLTFIIKKLEIVTERKRTSNAFPPDQMDKLKEFRNEIRELVRCIDACCDLSKKKATNTVLNNSVKDIVNANTKALSSYQQISSFIHDSSLNFEVK